MGSRVGAIPSAIGGNEVKLSHLGKHFPLTDDNLKRWSGWWRVVLVDQLILWTPGCFVGMALPALLSLEFADNSPLFTQTPQGVQLKTGVKDANFEWSNAIISADGMRRDPRFSSSVAEGAWILTLTAGLLVLLPSQLSVVDEVSRRWTDVIWSANSRIRTKLAGTEVKYIYYGLVALYFAWCLLSLYLFGIYGTPRLMTIVIANLGNLALGITAFHVLWINCRWLPAPIRPRWFQRLGLATCGAFYLTVAGLVFAEKQWPVFREFLS
jgi:hypothetical protein